MLSLPRGHLALGALELCANMPAIYHHNRTRHVARGIGGQQQQRPVKVGKLTIAPHGNAFHELFGTLALEQHSGNVG